MPEAETSFERADRMRAELAAPIDLQLDPLGRAAMEALGPRLGWRMLDVGCGTGQTVAQLAARVGASGRVTGIDIAPHVLVIARERLKHLSQAVLVQGDAAVVDLPPASLDAVYSRFGVMFFDDPVAAFGHLRRLLRPGGRIGFVCWRAAGENELDHAPVQAAGLAFEDAPHLGFADPGTIRDTLRRAGFGPSSIAPFDVPVSCGGVEETLRVVTRVGALGRILRDRPDLRRDAEPRVRAMLAGRAVDGGVSLRAATWVVTAGTV